MNGTQQAYAIGYERQDKASMCMECGATVSA